ncbi:Intersectin 1 (SH3 domain protein) [Spiromyces aspiralis]|uniref:Intersectin 1 (SH3 domain protein) n=1 Tax=Spiromyces aspiralis TaxID=68401 RepID=A0ACC1HH77_9FUNG|nr:Intersectin 1 (SH3 domain protein) [Spiromyces aspiralis]
MHAQKTLYRGIPPPRTILYRISLVTWTPLSTTRPISATDAISPDAVTRYATLFKRLDTTGRGFINGRDLMEVFARSRLSEHTLASIWQHADRDLDGSLTVPEFIVAMALIDLARSGEEVPDSIPIEYLRAAYCVAF